MTCIVGLKSKGKVYLGADSCASSAAERYATTEPKVFRYGPIAVGVAGDLRSAQILRYSVNPPKRVPSEPVKWLVTTFAPTLRKAYQAHGGECDATFLVAIGSRLFELESDFTVFETLGDFNAIGTGRDFARGVLHALRTARCSPGQKMRAALEAAAEFDPHVMGPFRMVLS